MSGPHTLADYSSLFAAVAIAGVGGAALWANPQRTINRLFCSFAVHVSLWLCCLFLATTSTQGLLWVRIMMAVGALGHFQLWLAKETVMRATDSFLPTIQRGRWWLLAGLVLAALCFTEWFIPTPSAANAVQRRGIGYWVYFVGVLGLFVALCVDSLREMRKQNGARRLELQLLIVGGSVTSLAVIVIMVVRVLTQIACRDSTRS
jgi:hypothetical protein